MSPVPGDSAPGVTLLVEVSTHERRLLPVGGTVEVTSEALREDRLAGDPSRPDSDRATGAVLGADDVDVVVVGAGARSPVAVVQAAHRRHPDAGVVVLTDPATDADVRRALAFAPGVPLEVVVGPPDGEVRAEVDRLRAGVAERRRHRAVLAAVTRQPRTPAAGRSATVVALGALLDHAPLGVLVCSLDGTLLGWNRRAAALLRLPDEGPEVHVDNVLAGAGAAVRGVATGSGVEPDDPVLTAAGGTELEVSVVPSQLDDGRLVALLSLVDVTARRRAERARERLSGHVALLARVSESLASTLDLHTALERLVAALVPAVADWASVQLTDDAGELTAVVMRHKDPLLAPLVEATRNRQVSASSTGAPSRRAARGEGAQLLEAIDEATLERIAPDPELRDLARRLGTASLVAVPLQGHQGAHGSLVVVNGPDSARFTVEDVTLVEEVGRRAAVALDNARLYAQQRDVAEQLQKTLLTPAPRPPCGEIQVRYVAAAHEAQVGGDWYDAFVQPDGTTVLVIGDVIGHDVRAAAGMSQVRGVLRGIAYTTGAGPAEILTRADQANRGLLVHTMATAVVATLARTRSDGGPERFTLTWASAGHPPPLVAHADGRVIVLGDDALGPDLLLGFDPGVPRRDRRAEVTVGATLLLYTDGLVERRGEALDDGILRLASRLRELAGLPLGELCDEVLAAMLPREPEDDVALVAIRLDPLPEDPGPLVGQG